MPTHIMIFIIIIIIIVTITIGSIIIILTIINVANYVITIIFRISQNIDSNTDTGLFISTRMIVMMILSQGKFNYFYYDYPIYLMICMICHDMMIIISHNIINVININMNYGNIII